MIVWARIPLLMLLGAMFLSGCVLGNPDFIEGSAGTESDTATSGASAVSGDPSATDTSASGGTDGITTSSGGSGGSGTSATTGGTTGDTGEESTTTGVVTTTTTEATTTTTGEELTTAGVEPGDYVFPATIATCVFQKNMNAGHGGPSDCVANAEQQNVTGNGPFIPGLMQVDFSVGSSGPPPGQGRRAESFLSFEISPEYADATITSAELFVTAADNNYAKVQSGELWSVAPFTETSLESEVPESLGKLVDDPGGHTNNETIVFPFDPNDLILVEGALYLALRPTHGQGSFFRGKASPNPPFLRLVVE